MTGPPGLWVLVYTLRPPESTRHPVGYTMAIAEGMGVWAIMVSDLAYVDNRPERISTAFDLATGQSTTRVAPGNRGTGSRAVASSERLRFRTRSTGTRLCAPAERGDTYAWWASAELPAELSAAQ